MPDKLAETRKKLKQIESRLLDMEDALDRLRDLARVGGLAADGMHGLFEDPAASALSAYFEPLAEKE